MNGGKINGHSWFIFNEPIMSIYFSQYCCTLFLFFLCYYFILHSEFVLENENKKIFNIDF